MSGRALDTSNSNVNNKNHNHSGKVQGRGLKTNPGLKTNRSNKGVQSGKSANHHPSTAAAEVKDTPIGGVKVGGALGRGSF
jgi:hypothetical protein